ncbi:MAG: MBL fold metallo-hydrolase [Clostridiales bacterium]|jgi:Cft2 family RNA processing exonuclease|nr:MBL fold metallo-hydrolase [Clostridiales bacterium]
MNEIQFIALGGGQEVGASCYFLTLNGSHILLDCGKKITPNGLTAPNLFPVLQPPFLESLSQIHQIFISHSHYDHLGDLPSIASQCVNAALYATPITKALARYVLWDVGGRYIQGVPPAKKEQDEILTAAAVDRIIPVGFCQTLTLPGYKATFYEAGHIPGASMIHLRAPDRSVLYTGDFSCGETALTSGCALPRGLKADVLIVCGLHAKHPEFSYSKRLPGQTRSLEALLRQGKSVHLRTSQLTKGLELLMMINQAMEKGFPKRNVYIDESILSLAEKMESLHIPVLREGNYRAGGQIPPHSICIGKRAPFGFYTIPMDFSLHPTFQEVKELIKHINPTTAVIVHAGPSYSLIYEKALETALLAEQAQSGQETLTRVIYAENGRGYVL